MKPISSWETPAVPLCKWRYRRWWRWKTWKPSAFQLLAAADVCPDAAVTLEHMWGGAASSSTAHWRIPADVSWHFHSPGRLQSCAAWLHRYEPEIGGVFATFSFSVRQRKPLRSSLGDEMCTWALLLRASTASASVSSDLHFPGCFSSFPMDLLLLFLHSC